MPRYSGRQNHLCCHWVLGVMESLKIGVCLSGGGRMNVALTSSFVTMGSCAKSIHAAVFVLVVDSTRFFSPYGMMSAFSIPLITPRLLMCSASL
jgi:hypothetical protein